MRPEIDWYKALADAEWLAGSTADTAERNLALAYLDLLKDYGDLNYQLGIAEGKLENLAEADT